MLSMNFKANLKKATGGTRIKEDLSAVAVPLVYWTVPTLLNLNGWAGLAAGTISTWLVGALLDLPGMTSGAIATASTHVFHSYFRDEFVNLFGKEPWNFEPTAGATNDGYMYGLAEGQAMLPVPDGRGGYQYVSAYSPTDLPAGGTAMNDYYLAQGSAPGMGDYYQADASALMDGADEDELFEEMMSEY